MSVSKSAMDKWVRQLKKERLGDTCNASPLTADKIKRKALEKKIKRIEMESEIIKKATALLILESLKSFRKLKNFKSALQFNVCVAYLMFTATATATATAIVIG